MNIEERINSMNKGENSKNYFLRKLQDTRIDIDSDISLLITCICFWSKSKNRNLLEILKQIEGAGLDTNILNVSGIFAEVDKIFGNVENLNFAKNPLLFIRNFLPLQENLFEKLLEKNFPDKKNISGVRILFEMVAINLFKKDCFEKDEYNPEEWLRSHQIFSDFWQETGKTVDDFLEVVKAGDVFDFKKETVKVKRNIAKARKECDRLHARYEFLFKQFLAAKGVGGDAFNPYEFLTETKNNISNSNKNPLNESMKSYETLVSYVAKLVDIPPSEMMKSLFFSKQNNSALELNFLLRVFLMDQSDDRLIVFPSPFLWKETIAYAYKGTDYIVSRKVIQDAYRSEFYYRKIRLLDNTWDQKYNSLLFIYSEYGPDNLKEIMKLIEKTECKIAKLFIPESIFNNGKESIFNDFTNYEIQYIVSVDKDLVELTPKKNLLVCLKKATEELVDFVLISELSLIANDIAAIQEQHNYVTVDDLKRGKNIHQAIKRHADFLKGITSSTHYKSGSQYYFSKEIVVQYRFVTRGKYKTAVFSYKSHPNNGKQHKLIKNTESGLSVKNEEDVFQLLDKQIFNEDHYMIIENDIRKAYDGDQQSKISLKTLWFLEYQEISKLSKYNQSIMEKLFSSDSKEISEMSLSATDVNALRDEIDRLTDGFTNETRDIYWDQLFILFRQAFERRYIKTNPLAGMARELTNRISKEQQEVRDALVKKSFTIEEQVKMLRTTESSWTKSESVQTLIIAFRLFTGISSSEMAALTWKDYEKITDYDAYHMKIKYSVRKGRMISYGVSGDWRRFRCVPIVKPLELMLARKKYRLQHEYGFDSKDIDDCPIFIKHINRKTKNVEGFSADQITNVCSKAVDSLHLEKLLITVDGEEEYKTDLNKYRADTFVSNFKYHANHTCELTRGEINYVLGIEAPDTFSKHYCDYTNDAIQYIIAGKLYRWAALLIDDIKATEPTPRMKLIVSGPYKDNAMLSLMVKTKEMSTLNLDIQCKHGAAISVLSDGKESN